MRRILIVSYGESNKNGGVASLCDLANSFSSLKNVELHFATPLGLFEKIIYRQNLLSSNVKKIQISYNFLNKQHLVYTKLKKLSFICISFFNKKINLFDYDLIVDGVGLDINVLSELKHNQIPVLRNHAGSPEAFYNYFLNLSQLSLENKIKEYSRLMSFYSGGLFQSQSHMNEFIELTSLDSKHSITISPSVSLKFDQYIYSHNITKLQRKLVVIGSLQERKGQLDALKIIKRLNDNNSDKFSIDFIGNVLEEDYSIKLMKFVDDNSLSKYVNFVGFSTNYIKNLAEAECLLVLSKAEGVPRVVRESLALNVPVVGYVFGDVCTELISNNSCYFKKYGDIDSIYAFIANEKFRFLKPRNGYDLIFGRQKYLDAVNKLSEFSFKYECN